MRDRIQVKKEVNTPVPGAGAETVYISVFADWCKVETVSNKRAFQDQQINLDDALSFTIRWRNTPQIEKSMLIEYNGNDYTVNSIKEFHDNKRKRFWLITAISTGQPVQQAQIIAT